MSVSPVTLANLQPGYIDRHGVGKDAMDKTMDALRLRANNTPLQGAMFFRTANTTAGTYPESDFGNALELKNFAASTENYR